MSSFFSPSLPLILLASFFLPVRCNSLLARFYWSTASLIFLLLFFNSQHKSSPSQHEMNHRSLEPILDTFLPGISLVAPVTAFLLTPAHSCSLFIHLLLSRRLSCTFLLHKCFSLSLSFFIHSSARLVTLTLSPRTVSLGKLRVGADCSRSHQLHLLRRSPCLPCVISSEASSSPSNWPVKLFLHIIRSNVAAFGEQLNVLV